ncbi:MAG: cation diffusion facilitator family transporter [Nannocystaceae bacterium]
MAHSSKRAVLGAMLGNGVLAVVKLAAFVVSGSGAMFSEFIHSLADTANQTLLFIGIRSSEKPADALFPYGYGAERYLYSLLSAAGIFVLGCGVTVYHGIHDLMDPPVLHSSWLPLAVLGLSFVVEGAVLLSAARVVWSHKGEHSLWAYLRSTSDPTAAAVLLEDTVACIGVLVAFVGIGLAQLTGNPVFDAMGAIVIGLLLGMVAVWLGIRNRSLLLGPAIPRALQAEIEQFLRDLPEVQRVRRVRTRIVGANRFRFQAELDFDGRVLGARMAHLVHERHAELGDERAREQFANDFGEQLIDELGREVDRIEAQLVERFPRIAYVDLEAD